MILVKLKIPKRLLGTEAVIDACRLEKGWEPSLDSLLTYFEGKLEKTRGYCHRLATILESEAMPKWMHHLRHLVGENAWQAWFARVEARKTKGENGQGVTIFFDKSFTASWVENHFADKIKTAVLQEFPQAAFIEIAGREERFGRKLSAIIHGRKNLRREFVVGKTQRMTAE